MSQLRNQVAIGFEEEKITAQDERLLLVQQWLEGDQGAQDIFGLWEHADPVQEKKMTFVKEANQPHLT